MNKWLIILAGLYISTIFPHERKTGLHPFAQYLGNEAVLITTDQHKLLFIKPLVFIRRFPTQYDNR